MKKVLITLLTVIMAVACVMSFAACDNAQTTEKLIGFDTELAEALAQELGLEIKFVEINWDTKESLLESKSVDLVWNGFTYTQARDNGYYDEERESQIGGLDFSNYYMQNKQVAVVKKSELANFSGGNSSFSNKKGCAEATSAGQDVIENILNNQCAQLEKQLDVFTAVTSGTYKYGVIDLTMASEYISSENGAYHNSLAVVELQSVAPEYYAVACREGSNMKGVLNYALAKLFKNGKAASIATTYGLSEALYNGFANVDTDNYTLPTDGDYATIKANGTLVVGYTIFAPMNYMSK